MNRMTNPFRLTIALLVVALLAACVPGEQPPSPEDIEAAVNTSVAMTMEAQAEIATSVALTVAAQNTQTAAAIPSPTNTPSVFEPEIITTDTPLASVTPLAPATPSPTPVIDPTITATPEKYVCNVYTQNPKYGEEVRPGENIKIKWIIVNTGTRPWNAGVDVKYAGGTQMTKVTRVEIPKALQPGERYTLVLDGVAPKKKGQYSMVWTVEGPRCSAYITIEVK